MTKKILYLMSAFIILMMPFCLATENVVNDVTNAAESGVNGVINGIESAGETVNDVASGNENIVGGIAGNVGNTVSGFVGEAGKTVGDVAFDDVYDKVSLITPSTGAVGPMTICMLAYNSAKSIYGEEVEEVLKQGIAKAKQRIKTYNM